MLAYFADDPNRNDDKNDNKQTIRMYCGLLYCFIRSSIWFEYELTKLPKIITAATIHINSQLM